MATRLSNAELEELDCCGTVCFDAGREIRELRQLVADMKPLMFAGSTNPIWQRLGERSRLEELESQIPTS